MSGEIQPKNPANAPKLDVQNSSIPEKGLTPDQQKVVQNIEDLLQGRIDMAKAVQEQQAAQKPETPVATATVSPETPAAAPVTQPPEQPTLAAAVKPAPAMMAAPAAQTPAEKPEEKKVEESKEWSWKEALKEAWVGLRAALLKSPIGAMINKKMDADIVKDLAEKYKGEKLLDADVKKIKFDVAATDHEYDPATLQPGENLNALIACEALNIKPPVSAPGRLHERMVNSGAQKIEAKSMQPGDVVFLRSETFGAKELTDAYVVIQPGTDEIGPTIRVLPKNDKGEVVKGKPQDIIIPKDDVYRIFDILRMSNGAPATPAAAPTAAPQAAAPVTPEAPAQKSDS